MHSVASGFALMLAHERARSRKRREMLRQRERRQLDDLAPLHRRLVRENADAGPVRGLDRVRVRVAILDESVDELMHQMRMRPAVAAALYERQVRVLVGVVDALRGE